METDKPSASAPNVRLLSTTSTTAIVCCLPNDSIDVQPTLAVFSRLDGDDGPWAGPYLAKPGAGVIEVSNLIPNRIYRLKITTAEEQDFSLLQLYVSATAPLTLIRARFVLNELQLIFMSLLMIRIRDVKTAAIEVGPPDNFREIGRTHRSITMSWSPTNPKSTGGLAVTAYALEYRASAAHPWIVASSALAACACRKNGLAPDSLYEFRVRVILPEGSGSGRWSSVTSAKTCKLDDTIEAVRRQAIAQLYLSSGLSDPLPLPTNSTPHLPMPQFPHMAVPSAAVEIGPSATPDRRRLGVLLRRSHLINDSYSTMQGQPPSMWARGLMVRFDGEAGVDYGALTRDWLTSLASSLVREECALFTQVSGASVTHPSPASIFQTDHLGHFHLFGLVLGKAFLENITIAARLSVVMLKALLDRRDGALADLRQFDIELHRSLRWMLENDVTDVIDDNFSTTFDVLGQSTSVDLLPGGANIVVTEDNKDLFVDLKARAAMVAGVKEQISAFSKGFAALVPPQLLRDFTPADLQIALSGNVDLSVHEWRRHTELPPELKLSRNKPLLDMFWEIVAEMRPEQRSKLLYFATACVSTPPGGFAELRPRRFNLAIEDLGPGALPIAHACFCTLVLPADINSDYELFRQKLSMAISECEGFGVI